MYENGFLDPAYITPEEQQRRSLPVRGAWIEIWYTIENGEIAEVAPCEGSVD